MFRRLLRSIGMLGDDPRPLVPASTLAREEAAVGRVTPRPDVLGQAFAAGFVGSADDERYPLRTVHLGMAHLPSGRVAALDPLTSPFGDVAALDLRVPPGRYPVDLAVADTGPGGWRVAMAKIAFSDKSVVDWRIAHTIDEDPSTLQGDLIFGYGVDSGTGSFADPTTLTFLDAALGEGGDYEGSQHQRWVDDGEAGAEALGIPHGFALIAAVGPGDIAMFSSGWGDGFYASWVGYDAAGDPVQLVTDFAVVEAVDFPGR